MDHNSDSEHKVSLFLNDIYKQIRQGSFTEAREELNRSLADEFDNVEIISALKGVNFWVERKNKTLQMTDEQKRGDYLFAQWDHFIGYVGNDSEPYEKVLYPVKQWVFSTALTAYQSQLEKVGRHDADLLCNIGRSFKAIGDYEHSVKFLELANHQRMNSPEILAELADAYALINEIKASKIFFREAFFIDPLQVTLRFLESMLINRLISEVRGHGYQGDLLKEWIPVYGHLYNVFNVKRELKPLEFGKLKQSIYDLEKKIEMESEDQEHIKPVLINRYLWLIDHYIAVKNERNKIDEITEKIRILDSQIYDKLT